MPLLHLFLIAVIQGLTEFLPVSSSGHLILLPELTGMADQGRVIDVAVHVGTLIAVITYFRRDVRKVLVGIPRLLQGDASDADARLALALGISTVPVVVVGLLLSLSGLADAMRSVAVIGWAMLGFGLVLYWFDRRGADMKTSADWTLSDALVMGLWQVLALIPGTSRSGITITGARALGYGREGAARLAMLMSIPTILAAGTLSAIEVISNANAALARDGAIAAVFAFLSALLALTLMMRLLRSVSFTPYVIYRVCLGTILLWIAYT